MGGFGKGPTGLPMEMGDFSGSSPQRALEAFKGNLGHRSSFLTRVPDSSDCIVHSQINLFRPKVTLASEDDRPQEGSSVPTRHRHERSMLNRVLTRHGWHWMALMGTQCGRTQVCMKSEPSSAYCHTANRLLLHLCSITSLVACKPRSSSSLKW